MIDTIKDIIDDVLKRMDEDMGIPYSEDAAKLIFETGKAESGYRYLEQMGGGPAVSFFQMEEATIKSMFENYITYRKPAVACLYRLGLVERHMSFCVMSNIALAVAFCRIYYWRKPGSIPSDIEGRAAYWKKHYNTEGGKGSVKHYLEANAC